jgi:chromosome segregation ATPase
MAKKNRNNKKPQNQPQSAPKPEVKAEVTVADVVESKTESEFEKNKEAVIKKFMDDIGILEEEKKTADEAAAEAKRLSEELEAQRADLAKKKAKIQEEYDAIKAEYDKAVSTIDSAQTEADGIISLAKEESETTAAEAKASADAAIEAANQKANEIRETAEKERIEKLTSAAEEAREVWKSQIEDLKKQIEDISRREKELHDAQLKLDSDRQDFEFEKEALDDEKAYVQRRKERYDSSSPAKVEELEVELKDEKSKYGMLIEKYEALSKRLEETQVLLDTVKTEIESSNGGKKIVSMREIIAEMQEFRDKYERLAAVYEKYPDDASISALEEKAQRAEKLERENSALEQERNRYREEAVAARNASKELEVVRQEVEATNALNEHLLQELESHKTALESRTGDTCPSLSKVDTETEETNFVDDINRRVQRSSLESLRDIVSHVKNYAGSRNKDERLYYTDNDIRAFLAGMAVSRLIILQGMSGTGKSSLPRIFSEAISGFNRLIPVESSWRDRNELLGYYNDFNKKFNAKSFTIELYRSTKKRCKEVPTFIVLDEMNLARIEYYFSDFLAILQEPDHDKWLIELVSSDMRTLPMELPEEVKQKMRKDDPTVFAIWEKIERSRQGDLKSETSDEEKEMLTSYLAKLGRLTGAKDLIDGRKIRVTDNIWFIGTANQDESTFEISDKVYDRAQVVSLNRKGVSEGKYANTEKKYISVTDLIKLFESAINAYKEKAEVEARLEELDAVLMDEFDISFGNRIVTQTVDFAAVFTAAGGSLEDALDYQISTKILRKVISSDDGEAFLELLDATKDYKETQRLINKRIKDLR